MRLVAAYARLAIEREPGAPGIPGRLPQGRHGGFRARLRARALRARADRSGRPCAAGGARALRRARGKPRVRRLSRFPGPARWSRPSRDLVRRLSCRQGLASGERRSAFPAGRRGSEAKEWWDRSRGHRRRNRYGVGAGLAAAVARLARRAGEAGGRRGRRRNGRAAAAANGAHLRLESSTRGDPMAKQKRRPEPKVIRPDDIDPHHDWSRPLQAPGRTQVDFEERVNFRRLHDYRLARVRAALANSGLGALLSFDQHNIRYTTSTVIGEWARDKLTRYSLLTGNGEPYIWDFGSAARHHKLYAPWLHTDHCRAGLLGMRGAVGADLTLFRDAAKEIKSILIAEGMANMPVGVDVVEPPMLFALQKEGIEVRDGQQAMLQAREVKNIDELTLLNMAAAMVDGVYTDIAEALKPGIQESQIVALATKRLYEMGSDCVEAINSISGERCSPHPHNFTDRLIRPGDQAFFDVIQSFMGYRTCYYRTFNVGRATPAQRTAYRKARQWMDQVIDMLKPGMSSDKVAAKLPKAQEAGFANEMDAFGLNFCHGLGLGLQRRPLPPRLTSSREPIELKAGMVFAVETYCPATDGVSAARIEEEVILTPRGAKIISLYPAEELPIANPY